MGATPTHQADVCEVDTDIWGPKDGRAGEILLPVPFCVSKHHAEEPQEGLLNVEGRAVCKGCR